MPARNYRSVGEAVAYTTSISEAGFSRQQKDFGSRRGYRAPVPKIARPGNRYKRSDVTLRIPRASSIGCTAGSALGGWRDQFTGSIGRAVA